MGAFGQDVAGARFQIHERLGAGSFGEVYKALDTKRNEVVALKTLRRLDPDALYRFKREFRALSKISHTNLVRLHELFAEDDRWFFTMALVEGVDFLAFVGGGAGSTADGVDEERLRAALRQLARGVQYLHGAGKLHRDLKPSNVLVTAGGQVVILDFGLVKELGSETSADDQIVGTAAYMAPEQVTTAKVTEAADWYAVGVMLYQALTGALPFSGERLQILVQKQTRGPRPPSEIRPDAPADLSELAVDLLGRDPALRPTGKQVLAALGADPTEEAAVPERSVPEPLFVGREAELEALGAAFGRVQRGQPVVAHVLGPPGMGKTALVEHALTALAVNAGPVILRGRCHEREAVPYKAIDSLIDSLCHHLRRLGRAAADVLMPYDVHALVRLFPVLERVEAVARAPGRSAQIQDRQELRWRAFRALRELLVRLSDRHPLVLWLDDLQWSDDDSGVLLSELLRPPDAPQLLLVACYRTGEGGGSLVPRSNLEALEMAAQVRLELGELPYAQALELANTLLPAQALLVESIARESSGNPLFVHALVRHVLSEEASSLESDITLEQVIEAQVTASPPQARRLLRAASLSHRQPIPLGVATVAAGLGPGEQGMVDLLVERQLLRRANEQLLPFHDRIRECVLSQLEVEEARGLHRALAGAFEAAEPPDPEALAAHFEGAGDDERAGQAYAAAANEAAEKLAFDRAAWLYGRALALGRLDRDAQRRLEALRGDALSGAGRLAEAARSYLAASDGAPATAALDLRRRAAELLLKSGHREEGRALLATVLAEHGMKLPRSPRTAILSLVARRARLRLRGLSYEEREASQVEEEMLRKLDLCWSAATGLYSTDLADSLAFQTRHLLLALRTGEPARVSNALAAEALARVAIELGSPRVQRVLERARSIAVRIGSPYALMYATLVKVVVAHAEFRYRDAVQNLDEELARTRESLTGVSWEIHRAELVAIWVLEMLGELDEGYRRTQRACAEARAAGDVLHSAELGSWTYAWLARDDVQAARTNLELARGIWDPRSFEFVEWLIGFGQQALDLYAGDVEAGYARFLEVWRELRRSLLIRVPTIQMLANSARGSLAVAAALAREEGGPEALKDALGCAQRLERRAQIPIFAARARLLRAAVAHQRGGDTEAITLLEQAAEQADLADAAVYAASARFRRGCLIGDEQGEALAREALDFIRERGAVDPRRYAEMCAPGFRG